MTPFLCRLQINYKFYFFIIKVIILLCGYFLKFKKINWVNNAEKGFYFGISSWCSAAFGGGQEGPQQGLGRQVNLICIVNFNSELSQQKIFCKC